MLRRRALAPTLVLSLCLALPAMAQQPAPDAPPPPPAAPTAAELRDKGRAALAGGDVAGACLLFEQSYQAAAKPGASGPPADEVLFDLADCHDKQGKSAIAAAEFEQVAAGGSGQVDEAKKRAAALRSPPKPATPVEPATPRPRRPGPHDRSPRPRRPSRRRTRPCGTCSPSASATSWIPA
jgi:hypothetical protein